MSNKFLQSFEYKNSKYQYFSLEQFSQTNNINLNDLPFSLKILLENQIRGQEVSDEVLKKIATSHKNHLSDEIFFKPARVLMQDFTGVPAVVDLATMRQELKNRQKDPSKINPLIPVDLIIDHSIQVDNSGDKDSSKKNLELEFTRNKERYEFLKWSQNNFKNFRVVPPGTGICHQINLENLAKVVWPKKLQDATLLYPDTVVGTDSHTTMINALSVLGWGVGGIEAESSMLGNSISMAIPKVVGVKLTGEIQPTITSTDIVLNITNTLRKHGVVGKFVEFYGKGLKNLSLADRATIANMAPEYGATCGFFATDEETLKYLYLSGRDEDEIALVELYCKKQGLFNEYKTEPKFNEYVEIDLTKIKPTLAGPKRPQDKVNLEQVKTSFRHLLEDLHLDYKENKHPVFNLNAAIGDGDIVVAAITSCTNTSNPNSLIAAGLLAKKAYEKGLKIKRFVKASFAPGSKVASEYIKNSGLQKYLDHLGFNVVGYGCTTCIGNSGPLDQELEKVIKQHNISVCSILSGNRNFEGRVHPLTKGNYLASPALVVAYAIAGNVNVDLTCDSLGKDQDGHDIYLQDIWPDFQEIKEISEKYLSREIFVQKYQNLFVGDQYWQDIPIKKSDIYNWDENSSYIRMPDFFRENKTIDNNGDISQARILAKFGDSITTDHISPAGNIAIDSPAAQYLNDQGISAQDFNSYGSRRGNHEVMMRGTFANIRIKNEMAGGKQGGYTTKDGIITTIYDAALSYQQEGKKLIVIAGKEYGTGSSRDWAAKGTFLLGVKAVIAESFERIHRSNLIGMGVLPLLFAKGENRNSLKLTGEEKITIKEVSKLNNPKQTLKIAIEYKNGTITQTSTTVAFDTKKEISCYLTGGMFKSILNN